MPKPRNPQICLTRAMELIHRALTRTLAEEVWGEVRVTERVKIWSLWQLALFWMAVAMHAPRSLRAALAEGTGDPQSRFSAPNASVSAFFARSQSLSWEFFAALFAGFRGRLAQVAPRTYAAPLRPLSRRFRGVLAIDGSRLDAVRHRLKLLWKERRAVLPGSLVALYDLATGTVWGLHFDPVAQASEFVNALRLLAGVPAGTLLVGDRLYGAPKFFRALNERGIFGVARRLSYVTVRLGQRLSRTRTSEGIVEDWEVSAGSANGSGPCPLRLIRLLVGDEVRLELFTNVIDPRRLSAPEALLLYRWRWKIERLFSDLKEVLHLGQFYGANVNAVAMQVFAATMVHTALRVAQALAAQQAQVAPEEISTKKFFPKAAAASAGLSGSECTFVEVVDANPGLRIRKPSWHKMRYASTTLDDVRVETRTSRAPRRGPKQPRKETKPGHATWRSLPRTRARRPPKLSRRR